MNSPGFLTNPNFQSESDESATKLESETPSTNGDEGFE